MFIGGFKEEFDSHKVKSINEKKNRVTVLHIENLTKSLYLVFPKRLDFVEILKLSFNNCNAKWLTLNFLKNDM